MPTVWYISLPTAWRLVTSKVLSILKMVSIMDCRIDYFRCLPFHEMIPYPANSSHGLPPGDPTYVLRTKSRISKLDQGLIESSVYTFNRVPHIVPLKPPKAPFPLLKPLWRFVMTGRIFLTFLRQLHIFCKVLALAGRRRRSNILCLSDMTSRSTLGRRKYCLNRFLP